MRGPPATFCCEEWVDVRVEKRLKIGGTVEEKGAFWNLHGKSYGREKFWYIWKLIKSDQNESDS